MKYSPSDSLKMKLVDQNNGFTHEINLDLKCLEIGDDGFNYVLNSIKNSTQLTNLDLGYNSITDEAENICDLLKVNANLKMFDLSGNTIGFKVAAIIGNFLITTNTLETLMLCDNNIGDKGAEFISKALLTNTTLKELSLACNNIGDKGAKFISKALITNTNLKTLDLSGNEFTDSGVESIAESLKYNNTLTTLLFAINKVTGKGAEFISEFLKANTPLKTLEFEYNKIGYIGAILISKALVNNTNLEKFNLYTPDLWRFGYKFDKPIKKIIKFWTNKDINNSAIDIVIAQCKKFMVNIYTNMSKSIINFDNLGEDDEVINSTPQNHENSKIASEALGGLPLDNFEIFDI